MKKALVFLILTTIGLRLLANPIVLPSISISELYYSTLYEWHLELSYNASTQSGLTIDSAFISSSSDIVQLAVYSFTGNNQLFVITQDSISGVLQINRTGDTITVITYCMGMAYEDVLIFGDCQGALINFPRDGQSISRYNNFYVKDNSPTIGFINDTIGICGTIWGTIYSAYSTPVSQRMFKMNYPFETNSVGEYSTRVFSKPSYLYYLSYYINPYTTQYALITPISYTMEPDSVIERDIYLLDTLITGLNNPAFSIPLKVYPNPLAVNNKLIIEIDLPVLTSVFWIILSSQDGKLLHKEKAEAVKTLLNMPAVSGVYLLTVIFDNRTISSTKVVVNNE